MSGLITGFCVSALGFLIYMGIKRLKKKKVKKYVPDEWDDWHNESSF